MASSVGSFLGLVRLPFGCVPVRVVEERDDGETLTVILDGDLTDVRSCDGEG